MANVEHGGDVSQRGPGEYLDPLAPLSSQFQQLESMVKLVFDDYEEFLQSFIEDVLTLPAEERFTEGHEILREQIEERFGSTDAFAAILPKSDPDKIPALLERLFDELLNEVLQGIFFRRDPEEHLILAALIQTLYYGIQRLEEAEDQETRNRVASSLLALLTRLHLILADSPESLPDEAIWDTAYGLRYLSKDDDGRTFPDPAELSFEEAEQEVINFGAVIAYIRLDISLSRGAELAGMSPQAFQAELDLYELEPRYGPDSVEALYDGVDE